MHEELLGQSEDTLTGLEDPRPKLRILMSIPDVAAHAGVSVWTIRQAIRRGDLIARRIGRLQKVTPESFNAWADGLPKTKRRVAKRAAKKSVSKRAPAKKSLSKRTPAKKATKKSVAKRAPSAKGPRG